MNDLNRCLYANSFCLIFSFYAFRKSNVRHGNNTNHCRSLTEIDFKHLQLEIHLNFRRMNDIVTKIQELPSHLRISIYSFCICMRHDHDYAVFCCCCSFSLAWIVVCVFLFSLVNRVTFSIRFYYFRIIIFLLLGEKKNRCCRFWLLLGIEKHLDWLHTLSEYTKKHE